MCCGLWAGSCSYGSTRCRSPAPPGLDMFNWTVHLARVHLTRVHWTPVHKRVPSTHRGGEPLGRWLHKSGITAWQDTTAAPQPCHAFGCARLNANARIPPHRRSSTQPSPGRRLVGPQTHAPCCTLLRPCPRSLASCCLLPVTRLHHTLLHLAVHAPVCCIGQCYAPWIESCACERVSACTPDPTRPNTQPPNTHDPLRWSAPCVCWTGPSWCCAPWGACRARASPWIGR